MKKFLFFLGFFLSVLGFSQELKPIAQKIVNQQKLNKNFEKVNLFAENNSTEKTGLYQKAATDLSVLKVNKSELSKIVSNRPETLEMTFPFEGKLMSVILVKNEIFTSDFKVTTSKGEYKNYTPGVYYQGIVDGDVNSLVAFSFFDNDVVGISSVPNVGNIVLGKAKDSEDFVVYSDAKLTGSNPFVCGVDEIIENQNQKISFDPNKNTNKLTTNCVRIYYEVGYGPYTQNSSNVTTTTNWVTAMHNNVATLYANDGINVALSSIFVWTTSDTATYNGTPLNILDQFRNHTTSFNGDIGQLLRNPATTSIAWLNSLCTNHNYSYCGVQKTYSNVPTYSWNIMVMTHEMGHNLGSPHTHACAWNGNNTAIDGCGANAGYTEGCDGINPPEGGTIMSYCHLTSVGINLSLGFGAQPGALIRNTVDSKGCLGTNCTASCAMTVSDVSINTVSQNSMTATIVDGTATAWHYNLSTFAGVSVSSGNTTSKNLNFSGLLPNTYYVLSVGASCSAATAYQSQRLVLTDTNWCGFSFADTGGTTGNYSDGQVLTKTFYPTNPGDKLTMTFTEFGLEDGYDYMNIYDGTSTASPKFANGNQLTGSTNPGTFTATNSSGAITVTFVSDEAANDIGWNANISCAALGVNNANTKNRVSIYPNPTKNKIFVDAKDNIKSCQIIDASGKLVKTESVKSTKNLTIDLSSFVKGNYIISIITEKETITKSIIKQ